VILPIALLLWLGFPAGSFMWGLCDLSSDAPSDLFKDRPVLIQTQSSVMMENHRIQQIDVWSQAFCWPEIDYKKTKDRQ